MAGMISMAGTQNTTSTSSFFTSGFKVSTNATASEGVMFIFQLPAIIFFLPINLNPFPFRQKSGVLFIVSRHNTRKRFALEEL